MTQKVPPGVNETIMIELSKITVLLSPGFLELNFLHTKVKQTDTYPNVPLSCRSTRMPLMDVRYLL